ncbi:MAG: hypothetical protein ACRDTJ_09710, partial [Pseudonocardiaceae bacterium]
SAGSEAVHFEPGVGFKGHNINSGVPARPSAVIADKAYSTGVIRSELRRRGIKAVIPPKSNHNAVRKRRGSAAGRPLTLDAET